MAKAVIPHCANELADEEHNARLGRCSEITHERDTAKRRDDQAVELVERLPTADEYVELLRQSAGRRPRSRTAIVPSGELTAICAVDERKAVVGMGRLVGDGRMYCFAVDVVVDPDAQDRGSARESWTP